MAHHQERDHDGRDGRDRRRGRGLGPTAFIGGPRSLRRRIDPLARRVWSHLGTAASFALLLLVSAALLLAHLAIWALGGLLWCVARLPHPMSERLARIGDRLDHLLDHLLDRAIAPLRACATPVGYRLRAAWRLVDDRLLRRRREALLVRWADTHHDALRALDGVERRLRGPWDRLTSRYGKRTVRQWRSSGCWW